MMLPLGATVEPARLENWDWQPAVNLDHIIQRGLEKPDRAFTVYLKTCDRSLSGAIIAFTSDGRIILGYPSTTKERSQRTLHAPSCCFKRWLEHIR